MKKIIILLSAAMALFASCQKSSLRNTKENGYLSFSEFTIAVDETVETKATAAPANYTIRILNADEIEILKKPYSDIKNNNDQLTLPAGNYTLVASSSDQDVPAAAFETPIYGASKQFTIVAGEVTSIGDLTCTLVQCKVTVSYSDEFLACVTGAGKTTVTLKAGYPLEYALSADKRFDQSAGYFAVEGNTLEVVFQGGIDGKNQKMKAVVTGIAPRQWRQIKFIQKKNEQGNATFGIQIDDLIGDVTLNSVVSPSDELILGEDPDAPKGDGGITLLPDYEAGCDEEITDLSALKIVPFEERTMAIKLKATVPNGILQFRVDISTDNDGFASAVAAADATSLNLIYPSAQNGVIFDVVPFPHGEELLGKTEVAFDLSAAQDAILNYKGTHTFNMYILDQTGCKNEIAVTMIVE